MIASGALAKDGSRWIAGGSKYLFHVRALSKVFRGKYLDGLAKLIEKKEIELPHHVAAEDSSGVRRGWMRRLRRKPWVVYSKAPFAGPRKLLDYLSRYTHRVAISNHRIASCNDGQVRFTYRDRRDGDQLKTSLIGAEEFIKRFLKHVLPNGFRRIRHYGFLANCIKGQSLARCRDLLGVSPSVPDEESPQSAADWMELLLGLDITCCPKCQGPLSREFLQPTPLRMKDHGQQNCRDP